MLRRADLHGLVLAVGLGGVALVHWARNPQEPPVVLVYAAAVLFSFFVVDVVLRPKETLLLPLTGLLVAVGLANLYRLRPQLVAEQAAWMCVGLALGVAASRSARTVREFARVPALATLLVAASVVLWGGSQVGAYPVAKDIPSQLAKLLAVLVGAAELHRGSLRGPVMAAWAAGVALVLLGGDVSTASLLVWVGIVVAYCAGASWSTLVPAFGGFLLLASLAHAGLPQLTERVKGWVNPWGDPLGFGYPLVQSLFAMGSGGLVGAGPGFGYPELVPQGHTTFALAALAEEWGFVGVLALLSGYAMWVGRALRWAVLAPSRYARLLAAGAVALVGGEAFLAGAAATGLLPATGAGLPFVSYGPASVVVHLVVLGLLLAAPGLQEAR
ncbi:MAG: hypothetical protein C4304_00865 [candidate division GAL15 bacterium]